MEFLFGLAVGALPTLVISCMVWVRIVESQERMLREETCKNREHQQEAAMLRVMLDTSWNLMSTSQKYALVRQTVEGE